MRTEVREMSKEMKNELLAAQKVEKEIEKIRIYYQRTKHSNFKLKRPTRLWTVNTLRTKQF